MEYSVRGSSIYEKMWKLMHNICDERFLNLTACFEFSPQKPLKEQEMNNNYDVWVISGLCVGFINFQQQ